MSTSVRVPSCSLVGTTKLTRCRGATPIPANRNFKPSKGFNSHHTLRRAAQYLVFSVRSSFLAIRPSDIRRYPPLRFAADSHVRIGSNDQRYRHHCESKKATAAAQPMLRPNQLIIGLLCVNYCCFVYRVHFLLRLGSSGYSPGRVMLARRRDKVRRPLTLPGESIESPAPAPTYGLKKISSSMSGAKCRAICR